MRQSSIIFAALLIGYVVFITLRGELKIYLQILGVVPGIDSKTDVSTLQTSGANTASKVGSAVTGAISRLQ